MSEELNQKREEWFENMTAEEYELVTAAFEFEREYFQDMLMIEYEEELSAVVWTQEDGTGVKCYSDIVPQGEITVDGWIFRNTRLDGNTAGHCDVSEKTICVDIEKGETVDTILLHEMIHAYESMLPEIYQQYITIRLFQKLQPKIGNLMELIHLDLHCELRVHTLLFMLKSLDLDLRMEKPLGTIYGYGRDKYFFNI